jgi:hypothetical protein
MVYVAEANNQYAVCDLDDQQLVDDCTNHNAEVTPLFTHPAQTPAGERAELIADLRLNHEYCPKEVILEAADMLEADVSLINEGNKAQQVAVPMTEAQIFACDPVPHVMFDQQRIDFARAIEAFHGITGAKS